MAVAHLGVRRVSPARLATVSLVWPGLGFALVVGGSGRLLYAAAPALLAGALALLLAARRRSRGNAAAGTPSQAERLLRVLAAVLAVGVVLAVALPTPEAAVAAAGGALLAAFGLLILLGLLPLAAAGLVDSRGGAEWFIAVRYLMAKRRQTFISIITGICVVGIAAGVWLVITVLSVMNGFERTWREEIIGNRAHFTVHSGLGPFADYGDVLEDRRVAARAWWRRRRSSTPTAWCAAPRARSWPYGCTASIPSASAP